MAACSNNRYPALPKPDMHDIIDGRGEGIAGERHEKNQGDDSVVDMVVFFELRMNQRSKEWRFVEQIRMVLKPAKGQRLQMSWGIKLLTPSAPSLMPKTKNEKKVANTLHMFIRGSFHFCRASNATSGTSLSSLMVSGSTVCSIFLPSSKVLMGSPETSPSSMASVKLLGWVSMTVKVVIAITRRRRRRRRNENVHLPPAGSSLRIPYLYITCVGRVSAGTSQRWGI